MNTTRKKVLVTAGNTRVPIDRVRGIDNIFKGRTGAAIAKYFSERGCEVTILTSHPHLVKPCAGLKVLKFSTYGDLFHMMEKLVRNNSFDIIIHSAAVSDYQVNGTFAQLGPVLEIDGRQMRELVLLDNSGKIGSDQPELWMWLTPTVKIVDLVRKPWGFNGVLVKFKLQVGMDDEKLIEVATRSMEHSKADFIVANTLEGMTRKAFIISAKGNPIVEVDRADLPTALYREVIV